MPLLTLLLGYLLGSIPSGFLAGQWCKGIDLRTIGSGSTGAASTKAFSKAQRSVASLAPRARIAGGVTSRRPSAGTTMS